jgi:hypothetical protein
MTAPLAHSLRWILFGQKTKAPTTSADAILIPHKPMLRGGPTTVEPHAKS